MFTHHRRDACVLSDLSLCIHALLQYSHIRNYSPNESPRYQCHSCRNLFSPRKSPCSRHVVRSLSPSLNWILLSSPSLLPAEWGLVLQTLSQQRISIDSSEEDNRSNEAAVIPTAEMHRTLYSHTVACRQWTCLSIVVLLEWFTASRSAAHHTVCAAAQCCVYGDITHASCFIRACDEGSTSPCGSWLNQCSSQASAQHHRHHDPMVSHPATSCLSLRIMAECTMHTSCMFSYRMQLADIFPAYIF